MKITHPLSNEAQMILLALLDSNGKVKFKALADFLYYSTPVLKLKPSQAIEAYSNSRYSLGVDKESQARAELSGLEYLNLIKIGDDDGIYSSLNRDVISLTDEGRRIAESILKERRLIFRPKKVFQTTVFIACAFGRVEIDELYSEIFEPACISLGYKVIRVDMTEPHQTITEKIMDGITEAACVIADLTFARPSVYFEVGYAVGLGIPLLITCRQDHFRGTKDDQKIHFDLEQYKTSFWNKNGSGDFVWQSDLLNPMNRLSKILPKLESS